MAKRQTNTNKWKTPFVRGLQGSYKLLWFYINDDCDHAGIWQVDMDVAQLRIGPEQQIDKDEAIRIFGKHIEIIDEDKWFIPSFIDEQYGELNPANRVHQSVILLLAKDNIDLKNKNSEKIKGHISPLQGSIDKDIIKDIDKDKDIEGGVGETGPPEPPKKIPIDFGIDEEAYDCQLSYMLNHSFFTIIQMHRSQSVEELTLLHRIFFEQKAPVGELKGKSEMDIMKFFYRWIPIHIKSETDNKPKHELKRTTTFKPTATGQTKAFGKL